MKLEITDVSFHKDEYSVGQLSKDADVVPKFHDIDKELFSGNFFENLVRMYIDVKFFWDNKATLQNCFMLGWLHEPHDTTVFDIKKDDLGNYYIVAGDETGIVYFEKIKSIEAIINGHPTRIQEQANFYLIEILDEKKDKVYDGYKMTLKEAIEDMFTRYNIRTICPIEFRLGT